MQSIRFSWKTFSPNLKSTDQTVDQHEAMKHFTFYQNVHLIKILTPTSLKKLRSEKINFCLVDPIIRKLVTYAMRSSGSDTFLGKTGVKKLFAKTGKNTVISPNFRVPEFCGKSQFRHSFVRFARNYAETAPFQKIAIPGN